MGAGELTPARWVTTWCLGTLVLATLIGAGVERVIPRLAASAVPHPSLRPTLAAILSVTATNLRVLAAPPVLVLSGFAGTRTTRLFGDAVVAAILGGNALDVGIELGRWTGRLLPYIPQLPIEYLAASTAAAIWITGRRGNGPGLLTASLALITAGLVVAAAVVEVLFTPHAGG